MKEIKLSHGKVALVDDENYEWLNSFKWYAYKDGNTFYAVRHTKVNSKRIWQSMHQLIMGDNPLKLEIDHRDGDGLNNQKSNLRFCTKQQNQMNQRPQLNCSSKYKGVHRHKLKKEKKWEARIAINQKTFYLGSFAIEEDAARAYDMAAIKYYGEFARLNILSKSND